MLPLHGAAAAYLGYQEYHSVSVGPGHISIRYPDGVVPCIERLEDGIECAAENLAEVTLTNGSPVRSNSNLVGDSGPSGTVVSSEQQLTNPFEAILERQSNPSSEESDNTFTVRKCISPEDVPVGMKVVSTPFGDRLVEDE